MTPLPIHDDLADIITVTDKRLQQTLNKTSKRENYREALIGTNFDDLPITEQRMLEIFQELGYDFNKVVQIGISAPSNGNFKMKIFVKSPFPPWLS